MKIGIVGAGIGGLTAAAMLNEQGHQIEVFEKKAELSEVGAGIGIGGNVLNKLGQHDLAKGIKNAGQILERLNIYDQKGHQLAEMGFSIETTNVTLKRQTLLDIIASYVPEHIIQLNHEVKYVEIKEEHVLLTFTNHETRAFDLVIGADGVHSNVRQAIFPKSKVNYQGYTCFRGIVDGMEQMPHVADEYWGEKGRFGIVSLLNGQAYWFATMNAKANDPKFKGFNKPYLQAYFNHYPEAVRKVLDEQPETEILHHDIYDMKPLTTFTEADRVVLLGDAAHTTTPNMGQGATQAMEDAIVLANVLQKYDTRSDALKRYNRLRVKHTKKVIKRSRKIGKMAQKDRPISIKMRNALLKRMPERVMRRQTTFLFKSKKV
ncbi:FAD-dependent monooxygenase [Staphylococcus canis]|uniref:NAD(P)-binding protein n=1 Tax=Staphylococcus canis TaxID=2724942 RepID=A0ABS0T783_9STAP|nr:FAD-dependent monooxygenase [Staphylococcus canis]MBI5974596.1 NAD(P)-binding protein [Staphylococcus canis]